MSPRVHLQGILPESNTGPAVVPSLGIRRQRDRASRPFTGVPISIPGTFQAENFDLGGEGIAYHDAVPGNSGGVYRTTESVDLYAVTGGYAVQNFDTGEWLKYTIVVTATGAYDIAILASNNAWPGPPKFHIEIDNVDVTGSIPVPSTGGWDTFSWVTGVIGVVLAAGVHVLKLVSDQSYFNVDALRVLATGGGGGATLLFSSGYESPVALATPSGFFGDGCIQDISGQDGFGSWPLNIWGGTMHFFMFAHTAVDINTIGNFINNRIETVTGHGGGSTKALYSELIQRGGANAQDTFMYEPASEPSGVAGDLYISFWLKFQPDLLAKMTPQTWRSVFEWKTSGDYRVNLMAVTWGGAGLYWQIQGDNEANGGYPGGVPPGTYTVFWQVDNHSVPVPVDQWFKLELFWHRSSGTDARFWAAVGGSVICDITPVNGVGNCIRTGLFGANNNPINRIMMPNLYSGSSLPIYQWVDDLRIYDGFPSSSAGDPPYAPH